jgi:hypothetical protein
MSQTVTLQEQPGVELNRALETVFYRWVDDHWLGLVRTYESRSVDTFTLIPRGDLIDYMRSLARARLRAEIAHLNQHLTAVGG